MYSICVKTREKGPNLDCLLVNCTVNKLPDALGLVSLAASIPEICAFEV